MPFDPMQITSLFDIVLNANVLTNNAMFQAFLFGLNLALASRYSNRRHGLIFVGAATAFLCVSAMFLYQINFMWLFLWGCLEMIVGFLVVTKESTIDIGI